VRRFVNAKTGDEGNFVGALIALGAAIFSAANNIVMAKLGRRVATSIQVPTISVRWLYVDRHIVDGHFVICHLRRIVANSSLMSHDVYVAIMWKTS